MILGSNTLEKSAMMKIVSPSPRILVPGLGTLLLDSMPNSLSWTGRTTVTHKTSLGHTIRSFARRIVASPHRKKGLVIAEGALIQP